MILEGKSLKKQIIQELATEVYSMSYKPSLVVIQVGDDPASNIYIRNKAKMCENIGYRYELKKYSDNVTEELLLKEIDNLNNDNSVNGILVQMPLPSHLDEIKIQNSISPLKDVDGLTDINMGMLAHKKETLFPCTAIGIIELLDYYNVDVSGKNVVVVGRSNLVGRPVAELFINRNATVTVCHSYTKNLANITKKADILVVAVGVYNLITSDMVKEDCIIIDVGINSIDGKMCGDVDFDRVVNKVKGITPVPGGVGQMTVAELAKNILKAYKLQQVNKK